MTATTPPTAPPPAAPPSNAAPSTAAPPAARNDPPRKLPAILCVDDDPAVLDGFRRQLRKKFDVHTAEGPGAGLEAVTGRSYGVIVSDYHMPGMNGIEFLTKVRSLAPDAVRIMLTGQADFSTAMGAVNQGNIFRFLVKPCTPVVLEKVLEAGFEQHRLLIAERQLTRETLLGCVQVLVDVLSIVQPEAFSRATRVRRYVRQIAEGMDVRLPWQIEAAAMLSQVGWITLPPDTLAKAAAGQTLHGEELSSFLMHPSAAARILEKIPRLDSVSAIIERQNAGFEELLSGKPPDLDDPVILGTQLLKAATDFDILRYSGLAHADVIAEMRRKPGVYAPEILDGLAAIEKTESEDEVRLVPLSNLQPGMIVEDELRSKTGVLLLARGHEIPETLLERLRNFSYGLPRDLMCKVRIGAKARTQPAADARITSTEQDA